MTNYKVGDEVIYGGGLRYDSILRYKTPSVGAVGIIVAPRRHDPAAYLVAFPGVGNVTMGTSQFRLKNDPEERRFLDALDMINSKTGSPGLTSWHDGKVGMALSEFERLAGLLPEVKTGPFEVGEVVYFTGYTFPTVDTLTVGDAVTLGAVGVRGAVAITPDDGRQWLYFDEISRTKP